MKTLLTLLLLIPSLAWTDDIKYLVCFSWDEKINKVGIKSIGLKLNTNTKEHSIYQIQQKSDGDYTIRRKGSDEAYSQNADYITVSISNTISIDRKNLEWWHGTPRNLGLKKGKCELVDSQDSVVKVLSKIMKDNLDLNKI